MDHMLSQDGLALNPGLVGLKRTRSLDLVAIEGVGSDDHFQEEHLG